MEKSQNVVFYLEDSEMNTINSKFLNIQQSVHALFYIQGIKGPNKEINFINSTFE